MSACVDGTVVTTADDADGDLVLAVYPWDITISTVPPNDSAMNLINAPIRAIAELGNRVRVIHRSRERRDHVRLLAAARPGGRTARVRIVQGNGNPGSRQRPPGTVDRNRMETHMKLSTRNQLSGTVTGVTLGTIMSEITVDIGGQTVVAAITRGSAEELELAEGDQVTVLIKATEVMLGK